MRKLILHLKGEYFDEIKAGRKPKEYRLVTPYWEKRLVGRTYDGIELARGYPKRGNVEHRLTLPWLGYQRETILHRHFGPYPVEVFAINVAIEPEPENSEVTGTTSAVR
ncbi:ASCH domain-containing protein [Pseudomonas aeruginosa]